MKLYIIKVNGKLFKAVHEDWNWEEAQKHLKQTFGEDAVIEFVSSMPEENFKDLTKFKLEEYER
jgi:hypothetical protein